jgi:hypothetical protein
MVKSDPNGQNLIKRQWCTQKMVDAGQNCQSRSKRSKPVKLWGESMHGCVQFAFDVLRTARLSRSRNHPPEREREIDALRSARLSHSLNHAPSPRIDGSITHTALHLYQAITPHTHTQPSIHHTHSPPPLSSNHPPHRHTQPSIQREPFCSPLIKLVLDQFIVTSSYHLYELVKRAHTQLAVIPV